jgi:hypothetical protein
MGHVDTLTSLDTLTSVDTLIFSQALGLNRQITVEEAKIQHVNPYLQPEEDTHLI